MKKHGILNAEIASAMARLGHTDSITISDAGLPIPEGPALLPKRIDLAVKPNLPRFLTVVEAVLNEMVVEKAIIAQEMSSVSPEVKRELRRLLGDVPLEELPHEDFKQRTGASKAIIRTGEFTPYANVILVAGVPF